MPEGPIIKRADAMTTTIKAPDPAPPQVEVRPDVEVVLRFVVPYAKAGPYLEDIDGIQERIREDYFQDATDFNWSMGLE